MNTFNIELTKITDVPIEKIFEPGEHLPVAFDIDGIVLDTATEMWNAITSHLELPWSLDKWIHYDIGKIVGVPTSKLRVVYEPVLYNHALPPVNGAVEALCGLYESYKKPLLFITSRRAQFKQAAINSIKQALGPKVKFEVLCTGDIYEDEFRNDKLDLLKEYKVEMFVEDNYLYWEKYIDARIHVVTLKWPWTKLPYLEMRDKGKRMYMFDHWDNLKKYIDQWLALRAYQEKMRADCGEMYDIITRATNFLTSGGFVCDKCGYEFERDSFSFRYKAGVTEDTAMVKCPKCGRW
jgi:uncharacterized HAD superfamily protein